eukprot:8293558-Pyramimonas_sp.AAC.1
MQEKHPMPIRDLLVTRALTSERPTPERVDDPWRRRTLRPRNSGPKLWPWADRAGLCSSFREHSRAFLRRPTTAPGSARVSQFDM